MARLSISCIVRRFCLDCQGNSSRAVRECADTDCALWEHRLPPQGTESPAPSAEMGPAGSATLLAPTAHTEDSGERADAAMFTSSPDAVGQPVTNPNDVGRGTTADAAASRPATSHDAAGRPVASHDAAGRPATSHDAAGRPATSHDAQRRLAARRAILRAVRRHCMSCAACRADVRTCAARECGLWSYRFGVYPETYRAVRQRFFRPKALSLF